MSQTTITDHLRFILKRGSAFCADHAAVAAAVRVLGLDATDPQLDHPLMDLAKALKLRAAPDDMIRVNAQQRYYLEQAIFLLERNIDALTLTRLQLGATADRLRLMVRRQTAYYDDSEDIGLAWKVMRLEHADRSVRHLLTGLYYDLISARRVGGSKQLNQEECAALTAAAVKLEQIAL